MKRRKIPSRLRQKVREDAQHRCGYCLAPQNLVWAPLEIEHIIPQAKGGSDDEENLWMSCPLCNGYKGAQMHAIDPVTGRRARLFNPRRQKWADHFVFSDDGVRIIGLTVTGRVTVLALRLNNEISLTVRRHWIESGFRPPYWVKN